MADYKKPTVAILSALLLYAQAASASEWVRVCETQDTAADGRVVAGWVWIDKASIARKGALVKAWVRYSYISPVTAAVSGKPHLTSKGLYYFNCSERSFAVVLQIDSDETTVVETHSSPLDRTGLSDVAPDTQGEQILNLACSLANGASKSKTK